MRDIPPLTVPARFASYVREKMAVLCRHAEDGTLNTVPPFLLDADGPPVTITFTDNSSATPTLCSEAA